MAAEIAVNRDTSHYDAIAMGAVDIGGTKIAAAAVSADGRILARDEMPTCPPEAGGKPVSFDTAMTSVSRMLEHVRSTAKVEFSGIGIGCTGPVDPGTGEVGDVEFLPGWSGCNPVARLSQRFEMEAALENDADAAALGEVQWGAGRGKRSVVCVTVGTGIGGGIILDGRLYRGVGGAHPEIGHHVIDASGPQCFCGATGCWEVLAAGPAIVNQFLSEQSGSRDPSCEAESGTTLTARAVCDLARAGEPSAMRVIAREGRYLGIGIANLVGLFTPELIVLSGSVMESSDLFLPEIRQVIRRNCGLVPSHKVELTLASLGRDAPLIGAAAILSHRHQRTPLP